MVSYWREGERRSTEESMYLILLTAWLTILPAAFAQGNSSNSSAPALCTDCLRPIWLEAVADYGNGTDPCTVISLERALECLDTCETTPVNRPLSLRIRQLTQLSDIFYALRSNNCPHNASNPESCSAQMECLLSVANYDYQNSTAHSPHSTVFDYKCGLAERQAAAACLRQTTGCTDAVRSNTLMSVLTLGVETACDEPRRCVKYGNIFEVNPGSNCTEYFQEAAAYGPSMGKPVLAPSSEGYNPAICDLDYLSNFTCPDDPAVRPIFTELPETTTTAKITSTEDTVNVTYSEVIVDTGLPCEQCLYPLWYRAVTTDGPHLCEHRFQNKIFECLAKCQCCPTCQTCANRRTEHNTEVFVKLADIFKALDSSNCTGNPSCTAESYKCTEHLARFNPPSAPHVTVNTFSCRSQDLQAAQACYSRACNPTQANLLTFATLKGFNPICESNLRCMSYGSIFEYVRASELNTPAGTPFTPCEHYRKTGVNGWNPSGIIIKSKGTLLFNTGGCWEDFPPNVNCPTAQLTV